MDRDRRRRTGLASLTVIALVTGLAAGPGPAVASAETHTGHRAVVGDFDGDGVRDLAIGAPGRDHVQITYSDARIKGSAVAYLAGHAAHVGRMGFGSSLAVGDFNGDGYSDLAVAAPSYATHKYDEQGAVFIFRGSPTGLHEQSRKLVATYPVSNHGVHGFGDALATADVNHDGYADLAVSQPQNDHRFIALYRGSLHGLRPRHYTVVAKGRSASALAFGDVNGDGHPDLVLGLPDAERDYSDMSDGAIAVVIGSARGLTPTYHVYLSAAAGVKASDTAFGSAVAVGDINHDGYSDVVVGAPYNNEIVVLFGSKDGLRPSHRQSIRQRQVSSTPSHYLDGFGSALAIGDVTGDGFADVVVGAPGARVNGHDYAGQIFFLRGSTHGLTLTHHQMFTQDTAGVPGTALATAQFGSALSLAARSGDAHLDLEVSAPNDPQSGHGSGFVVGLLGSAAGLITTGATSIEGTVKNGQLGTSIR
jgi:hypothetical protein